MAYRRMLESAVALLDNRRVRLVAQGLLLATIVFVVIRLRSLWSDNTLDFSRINWGAFVLAVSLATVAALATGLIWVVIVRRLGCAAQWRAVTVFFQAQLGKYIPGAVWQYASRAALAQSRGLPVRPVALSLPIEIAASLCAAAALSALLRGWPGIPVVLVVVAAAVLIRGQLRKRPGPGRLRLVVAIDAALIYLPVWLLTGGAFWLTARALVAVPGSDLLVYVGAFTVAWTVGLLAVYAPGGIGVREAVLIALLRGRLASADALVVASAFRAIMTLIDVGAAGVTVLALRRREGSLAFGPEGLPGDMLAARD